MVRRGTVSRLAISLGIASVGLLGACLRAPAAHAEISVCYTDPVVVLSNGTTLDLNDTISDSYTDVQQIVYTLHAPAGTSIVSVAYTSGPIGPVESLRFVADQPANQYNATSSVTTGASSVAVTAAGTLLSLAGTGTDSENGWNGQKIRLSLAP